MEVPPAASQGDADEWELRHDESSGQAYYVNLRTGESSWEPPGISALPSESAAPVHRQWTEAHDETGRVYFVNLETMETSWEPPPGFYRAVSARAAGVPGSVEDTLMRRPSTAEQMEQLNALLSGGDGDEDGDEEGTPEQLPSTAVVHAAPVEEDASAVTPATDGSEWMMFLNETDGIPYYYNHITGECVWEPPAAFLEYHLQHSEAEQSNESHYAEHDPNAEPSELHGIMTPAPHPPMSPPPATPAAQTPVSITPEFEEKVRRAIETVSKTPVGSSRLLFVRTPTVKSIEGVSSGRAGSRPASSSGRSASRPSSSTGTARQRVATARTVIDGEQTSLVVDGAELPSNGDVAVGNGDDAAVESPEVGSPDVAKVSEDPTVTQEEVQVDTNENEELNTELQRHDEMMQEIMFDEAALVMQCLIRCFMARRRVARKRQERQLAAEVPSSDGADTEFLEPVHDLADQETVDHETPRRDVSQEVRDLELDSAEQDVSEQQGIPERAQDDSAAQEAEDASIPQEPSVAPPDDGPLQDGLTATAESEPLVREDGSHSVGASEVAATSAAEVEGTVVDAEAAGDAEAAVNADAAVLAVEETQLTTESDRPQVTANGVTDRVELQPDGATQGIADDEDPVDIGDAAAPAPSEHANSDSESVAMAASTSAEVVKGEEGEGEAANLPDSIEANEGVETKSLGIASDSTAVPEQAAIEEQSTGREVELQQTQLVESDVTLPIGSHSIAQAAREASTEKTPESTRRSARQAATSGRRTERDRSGAASASRTRDHPKTTADTSKGPLAVLNIASFFLVRVPRERHTQEASDSVKAVKETSQGTGGIVRKPVPTLSTPTLTAVKTEEQRHQERLARTAAKENERQEATTHWKKEVAQHQLVFADSAARSAAERQRVLEAETQRRQVAVVEKRDPYRKAAEAKSIATNQHTNSFWEAADNCKKDASVDQFRELQKAASEPAGFVDMMLQERLRTLKATVVRLQREGNDEKAAYWHQRVQSFPASAAELEECQDPYWTRLHSKLQSVASSSSAQELSQQLAKHRTDSLDSPLHMAAWHGNAAVVQLLASELSFDVNAMDNSVSKATPLHEASRGGHADVVECLLARGAQLDAIDAHGETPLHIASRLGHSQVVHRLIAAGEGHHDREDPADSSVHTPVLRSLSWAQCVHWRNHKRRRAIDVATLPSLKEFLTQYANEIQPETTHDSPSRNSSATAAKTSKVAVKKKKIKSARPKSAAKSSSLSMGTAAAALAVHAR